MDAPATPKHRKQLNRDQRLQVHTLYHAGHTQKWIAQHLSFTIRQIQYTLKVPITPQKKTGRPPLLSPERTQHLIQFIRSFKEARQMTYLALSQHFSDWHVGEYAIRYALRKAGYHRRVALSKPPLSEENKAKRLTWAEEHLSWTLAQWNTILWSDETCVTGGRHMRTWVTLEAQAKYDAKEVATQEGKRGTKRSACRSKHKPVPAKRTRRIEVDVAKNEVEALELGDYCTVLVL
ncbi:hypothetical protein PTT_07265 [Pyrenophora teres f. teres 0-1]|uniref:Transposase Tc1-like domain-containing protein n=1 Tax=Pyrenophora teres f. teres (strain 0-1) TaxID=861557 RepID=E3RH92_PYRTT|nr:hypothetical protein PTT_07265 [Pyrenophora teres f. teres 0-1]